MNNRQRNTVGGGRLKSNSHIFEKIISLDNLFSAWREFKRGKTAKIDVQKFAFCLEDNIFTLHQLLRAKEYQHEPYASFYVRDPKLRLINKATVRDRLLHQAVFRILNPIFDKCFIYDSYSCRLGKGTHRGVDRLTQFAKKCSGNYHRPCYVLQCDIRQFFASINHVTLLQKIMAKIDDPDTLWLIELIINSFGQERQCGLPLGNVTSQLFANIYLNTLDQHVKRGRKEKYYLRYCDDFLILHHNYTYLSGLINHLQKFLDDELQLKLHDRKVVIRKFSQGVDFLGYVSLPHYRKLRIRTKRRLISKLTIKWRLLQMGLITVESFCQMQQSYYGLLIHGKCYTIKGQIERLFKH